MDKEEQRGMLRYYWESKGRLDGWSGCEEALENHPLLAQLWNDYQRLERVIDVVVKNLED